MGTIDSLHVAINRLTVTVTVTVIIDADITKTPLRDALDEGSLLIRAIILIFNALSPPAPYRICMAFRSWGR